MLSFLPRSLVEFCSLFQWVPVDVQSSLLKKFIHRRVLRRSRVIATYSRLSEVQLRKDFPRVPVCWIGHFIDTVYFDPLKASEPSVRGDYMLVVGCHKRHEDVIREIASRSGERIVRVSADPATAEYHRQNPCSNVTVLTSVEFSELRNLYHRASIALNVVDDALWPVGITSFCEALAMDRPIVTPAGHSCSGYEFEDGSRPYETVQDSRCVDQWLTAIRKVRQRRSALPGRSTRDLAVRLCSFDAVAAGWRRVLQVVEQGALLQHPESAQPVSNSNPTLPAGRR